MSPMPGGPGTPPGPTAPATIAPPMDGKRMQGMIQANMGLSALERAAEIFGGTESDEGRKILKACITLRELFGSASPDVQRQELKVMGQSIPPVQQPTPQQGQNFQDAAQKMQAAQGMGQAA